MRFPICLPLVALGALLLALQPAGAEPLEIVLAGAQVTEHGLRLAAAPEAGLPAHKAGQACRATDCRAGQDRLTVLVPAPAAGPVLVQVSYLDTGRGQWALEYDAPGPNGTVRRTHGPVIAKQNTNTWKTAEFSLSDAGRSPAAEWRLSVDSFGEMVGEDNEFVRRITVGRAELGLTAASPVVATGGEDPMSLTAPEASSAGPRSVYLTATAGHVPFLTTLSDSSGDFTYEAPATAGAVTVAAKLGALRQEQRLLVWPGSGPAEVESILVDPTSTFDQWMHWPVGATISLGATSGEAEAGGGGAVLEYAFTSPAWPAYVDFTHRTVLRGLPLDLNLEVQGAGAGTRLEAILEDARGQRFCYPLGEVNHAEWTSLRGSLQGPTRYWGGPADGSPRYPLAFLSLRVIQGPTGSATHGRVQMRNVFIRALAPGVR
ncbi:MAG TPA: hypothetical protein VGM19_04610 [Armatimonadota bacterium]|jgi:hypothetical protein